MNSFAYVQQVSTPVEMNNSKDQILDKNLHRNQWEKVYKSTESLKNVIQILGNVIQGLGHSWAPIEEIPMEGYCQTTACLTGVTPEWIYC